MSTIDLLPPGILPATHRREGLISDALAASVRSAAAQWQSPGHRDESAAALRLGLT